MTDLVKKDLAESLVCLHTALDENELAQGCGAIIEELVGPVPWRVRLGSPSEQGLHTGFGGVGRTVEIESAGPLEPAGDDSAVKLIFRGEAIGELVLGNGSAPGEPVRSALGVHLGAALVNLRLWTQAEEESRERRLGQEMLGDISTLLGSFDIEYVLARSLDLVLRVVGSEVGSVMLWDGHRFASSVSLGLPEDVTQAVKLEGKSAAELVAETGSPVVLSDPDLEHLPEKLTGIRLSVLLVIPLVSSGRVVGVLQTANPRFGTPGSPYLEAAEEICRLSAVAVENALLHREAVQQERLVAIGQVMAGLSHDIKNMLHAMKSGHYLLQMGVKNGDMDVVGESLPMIKSTEERISGLVLDMLDYSKSRKPSRTPVDMNALADEIAAAMIPRASEKGASVEVEQDPQMEPVQADSTGIFRCLSNLVTNAVEAVPEGGTVELVTRWRDEDSHVEIAVRDNGPGIPEEDRERIFDALYTTKGSKGTGLGLAVTKKIIEEHGGEIHLESEPEQGTTFTICLPQDE